MTVESNSHLRNDLQHRSLFIVVNQEYVILISGLRILVLECDTMAKHLNASLLHRKGSILNYFKVNTIAAQLFQWTTKEGADHLLYLCWSQKGHSSGEGSHKIITFIPRLNILPILSLVNQSNFCPTESGFKGSSSWSPCADYLNLPEVTAVRYVPTTCRRIGFILGRLRLTLCTLLGFSNQA